VERELGVAGGGDVSSESSLEEEEEDGFGGRGFCLVCWDLGLGGGCLTLSLLSDLVLVAFSEVSIGFCLVCVDLLLEALSFSGFLTDSLVLSVFLASSTVLSVFLAGSVFFYRVSIFFGLFNRFSFVRLFL